MAAFFSQIKYKNGPQNYAQYNKEETVYLVADSEVIQPRTRAVMKPRPLGGTPVEVKGDDDRREKLVDWLVAPSNPFFTRAAVNRIWYHLMGRGIVEPVDDLRDSNPPASAELLEALANDFSAHGFDVKRTIRLITTSRAYQLSSLPNPFNAQDTRYFSHATVRMLSAEQLLDSASLAAGVPEKLFNLPAGSRAAQVPDGELVHPFLKDFGQPARADACECERGSDSTLEQALQVVGGRTLHTKVVAGDNRIGKLLKSGADDATLVEHSSWPRCRAFRARPSASWRCPHSPTRPLTVGGPPKTCSGPCSIIPSSCSSIDVGGHRQPAQGPGSGDRGRRRGGMRSRRAGGCRQLRRRVKSRRRGRREAEQEGEITT